MDPTNAEEFLKWAEVHHPDYDDVCRRTPLLTKYKMKKVEGKEISMSFLDKKDKLFLDEVDDCEEE